MMTLLAPDFTSHDAIAPDEISVGVAWTELADELVRVRVEAAADRFRRHESLDFPLPHDAERAKISDLFAHEVADVHRELYTEQGELYGAEVAAKVEACLAVSDAAAARGQQVRDAYRERCLESISRFDLLATPTLSCVAPAVGIGDAALRPILIRFTFPFNALGWPALALPCGPAEDGLPASIQLVGPPGSDGLVLAAGRLLAASLD